MNKTAHAPHKSAHYIGRLAPAPTGALHLGNARTFLIAWLRARRFIGKIYLRLEDLDHPKVKAGAARQAYADLAWLGLDWDAGPEDSLASISSIFRAENNARMASFGERFVQSKNLDKYLLLLRKLHTQGRVYPCVCTRKELEHIQSAPNAGEELLEARYPGTCRGRFSDLEKARAAAEGREPGWRFRVDDSAWSEFDDGFCGRQRSRLADWSGDFLVARGEKAGYQLAVVADDGSMGVTEVVRGDDLLASTHRQLALYAALGLEPPAFYHVPLVVGPDGRRLAKRHGDSRLSVLRERGDGPERVLGWLAWSCGWQQDYRSGTTLAAIARSADFSTIPREKIVATGEMLAWMGFGL